MKGPLLFIGEFQPWLHAWEACKKGDHARVTWGTFKTYRAQVSSQNTVAKNGTQALGLHTRSSTDSKVPMQLRSIASEDTDNHYNITPGTL